VAREARRSRNPLYTTHRELLAEIEVAAKGPTPADDLAATVAHLKAEIIELRAAARRHAQEKQALATENLALLHRAKQAEDRLLSSNRNRLARRDNLRTFEKA
jgi:erythromycin esterase-like protein